MTHAQCAIVDLAHQTRQGRNCPPSLDVVEERIVQKDGESDEHCHQNEKVPLGRRPHGEETHILVVWAAARAGDE